jgi:hypothetical protein
VTGVTVRFSPPPDTLSTRRYCWQLICIGAELQGAARGRLRGGMFHVRRRRPQLPSV